MEVADFFFQNEENLALEKALEVTFADSLSRTVGIFVPIV